MTPTLLIVEDDVDVADMLSAYFRVQDYDVVVAHCGEEALNACHGSLPNLVILDIRLPDMDGYQVARRLRLNRRTEGIPILFLTEKRDKADRLQGLSLGADDYITKPFDIQELRLRVRNSLRRTSESTLTNPVTGFPEGVLVDERLAECLESDGWAMLGVSLENLDQFREAYGFVASDDVQRAVSVMIHNAMRGAGGTNDFLGHLSATDFVLVTTPPNLPALVERIRGRLDQALDFFYPLKDRPKDIPSNQRLQIHLTQLKEGERKFTRLEDLKAALVYNPD